MKATVNLESYMLTIREPTKGERTGANDQGSPVHLIPKVFPYFHSIFFFDVT